MAFSCRVKTIEHGPVFNIIISAMRHTKQFNETNTGNVKVRDLAVVHGTLKGIQNSSEVEFIVKLKRSEAAKKRGSVVITCEGTVKHAICQDDWAEVVRKLIHWTDYINVPGGGTVYLYTVIVEITPHLQDNIPVQPSIIGKQLYDETEFTDFKLLAADGAVPVHKSVLFVKSEMFRTMLRGQWKETAEGSINMEGVSLQTLQHLKDFMYLGTIPDEELEPLLLVARRCLMDNLVAACIKKLITMVTPETFDDLAEFACQNNIIDLVRGFAWISPHVIDKISWFK